MGLALIFLGWFRVGVRGFRVVRVRALDFSAYNENSCAAHGKTPLSKGGSVYGAQRVSLGAS